MAPAKDIAVVDEYSPRALLRASNNKMFHGDMFVELLDRSAITLWCASVRRVNSTSDDLLQKTKNRKNINDK